MYICIYNIAFVMCLHQHVTPRASTDWLTQSFQGFSSKCLKRTCEAMLPCKLHLLSQSGITSFVFRKDHDLRTTLERAIPQPGNYHLSATNYPLSTTI